MFPILFDGPNHRDSLKKYFCIQNLFSLLARVINMYGVSFVDDTHIEAFRNQQKTSQYTFS